MKKQGTYQKRKERKNRVISVIFSFALCLLVFAFSATVIQNIATLYELDNGTLREYSGEFTYTKKKYPRNTSYLFSLDNGDMIEISAGYIDNSGKLDDSIELRFRYSTLIGAIPWGSHIGVSIETIDGDTVFLSEDTSKKEIQGRIIIYIFLIVLILLIPSILVFGWVLMNKSKIRRFFMSN